MPLIKSNIHTHTEFCDGRNSMEQMVQVAIKKGFETIGFSPHSFTKFDLRYCCKDFNAFRQEFMRIKTIYGDKIKLLMGIELDAYGELPKNLDYIIASVHYVKKGDNYYSVDSSKLHFENALINGFCGDKLKLAECYFDTLVKAVRTIKPDVIGHFDLLDLYGKYEGEQYKQIALTAVERLKETNSLVEINLGRCFKRMGGAYPADFIVQYMARHGFDFILSNDAHCTDALGYMFDEEVERLKTLGVNRLFYFDGTDKKQIELI